ncbi:M24 family metallopeptidase [Raineyella sp. W15-4]|uniref:M24 family metallopeptidase n=1 Tax=Raineyella sp. W15-4 TaxID=3081651 RepID=UPI00295441B6|nr:M24 family metallopeptidase [Raineyella sp. W15-4]WOQ16176.1 M24 family metallopeptidase [Raineyella sp. W15-4]
MVLGGSAHTIEILSHSKLTRARVTGRLVGDILHTLKARCRVGTNLLELDRWTGAMIRDAGALSCYVDYAPSFDRGPFGHYICTSVNDTVLHGMPSDYRLADGDLLRLDLAVVKDGIAAEAAISFIAGDTRTPQDLAMIAATEQALAAAITIAGPGARLGDLPHAIEEVLFGAGYLINTEFGGHGIGAHRTHHRDHRHRDGDPHAPECKLRARAMQSTPARRNHTVT